MWPEQMEKWSACFSGCGFAVKPGSGRRGLRPHPGARDGAFFFDGQEADDALALEAFEAVKASYTILSRKDWGQLRFLTLFLMFMWMVRRKKPEYDSGKKIWA